MKTLPAGKKYWKSRMDPVGRKEARQIAPGLTSAMAGSWVSGLLVFLHLRVNSGSWLLGTPRSDSQRGQAQEPDDGTDGLS